jgi:hypothetical protein
MQDLSQDDSELSSSWALWNNAGPSVSRYPKRRSGQSSRVLGSRVLPGSSSRGRISGGRGFRLSISARQKGVGNNTRTNHFIYIVHLR